MAGAKPGFCLGLGPRIPVVFGHRPRPVLAVMPGGCFSVFRMLDFEACLSLMTRRAPEADGVFYVAVVTTRIYCRPVCKARMPLAKNVRFYPSAAAAERAGFRPCMRCRPEAAPFSPAWQGTKSTVSRALKLIQNGALDTGTVAQLAEKLGMGPRHLGRLFLAHLGATPIQVAHTLRIQRARNLLRDSQHLIADIAVMSGFSSSRQMAAAFSKLYGCAPSGMRRSQRPDIHNSEPNQGEANV